MVTPLNALIEARPATDLPVPARLIDALAGARQRSPHAGGQLTESASSACICRRNRTPAVSTKSFA